MCNPIIKTEQVSVGYCGRAVLQGVELELHTGEIVTLVGPNGSGKSTLLKTIAAQLEPTAGVVWLSGKKLSTLSGTEVAKKLAVVLTLQKKTDKLTCEEVVSAGRYPYIGRLGLLREEDRRKIREAMELVDAWELREREFNTISDGQRQRVLLARAICQEPRVIILDEPTSFLDIKYKIELLSVLKRMAKEGKMAVLLSLHELDLAERISDRVVCVKGGRIATIGSPKEVLTEENICRFYDVERNAYHRYYGKAETPAFSHYIETAGKRLRCGYTTGTCAALAAAAATELLLTGRTPETVSLMTPKGIPVEVIPEECRLERETAHCAVRKDGGDDIDATAGLLIAATVERREKAGILIEGGKGIGRVTKAGLDQPIGAAAINRVPRKMIQEAVEAVCQREGEKQGIKVLISVPQGEEIAKKTFNPHLGIEGGISILGTSGIVEPMSIQALIDTKKLELHQAALQNPKQVILTPGNYGVAFLQEHPIADTTQIPVVVCSNFIGELLDAAGAEQVAQVLLVGHIGKLIKLAGGIMNTHSRWGDCRTELFCTYTALCGGSRELCKEIMDAATTDACIALLQREKLWDAVKEEILQAIQKHLNRRAAGKYRVGAVLFSTVYGESGKTAVAAELLKEWKQKGDSAI